jgi:S-DNA-T family DNA segregation ATPase FtsK/SpoIIIE
MDELEKMGIIGPYDGAKPRKVLMTKQQYEERKMRHLP